jgi:hypothetical protein
MTETCNEIARHSRLSRAKSFTPGRIRVLHIMQDLAKSIQDNIDEVLELSLLPPKNSRKSIATQLLQRLRHRSDRSGFSRSLIVIVGYAES